MIRKVLILANSLLLIFLNLNVKNENTIEKIKERNDKEKIIEEKIENLNKLKKEYEDLQKKNEILTKKLEEIEKENYVSYIEWVSDYED